LLTHSGVEIGQGIDTKVSQFCAYKLGIDMKLITLAETSTKTSPNAFATGGSVTSELSSAACSDACDQINKNIAPVRKLLGPGASWQQIIAQAFTLGIQLQAVGHFAQQGKGPISAKTQYNSYSAAVHEVEVDILTGEISLLRTDILFDAGISLNPLVDIGQIEGAYTMGLGNWLTEYIEYKRDSSQKLHLYTNNTWEYKPLTAQEIPENLIVALLRDTPNPIGILSSKASGEPPQALSCGALFAIQAAVADYRASVGLDIQNWSLSPLGPATVEVIQTACETGLTQLLTNVFK